MKLGIALSGGGIRGIAHAGVLKALEDNNIKIDIIGGTSAGSLIAALYAMGYSPYYIYILFKRYSKELVEISSGPIVSGISNFMLNKKVSFKGLKSGKSLETIYNQIAYKKGIRKIEQIEMPIVIPTVDIIDSKEYIITNKIPEKATDKKQYITNITVGKAVRASSSFPAVFMP
ncbi:patatin-like phospholipase family protein, partial [Romboutsia ilealis]|uniref:patatin-like phospholipase family protein n=1 Tax=Romboutsia ilealis TaxID=1115758 RepID=UPI00272B4D5A